MDIRPITSREELSALIRRIPHQPFLQSWAWGEFQERFGRRVWRFGAYDGTELVGAMTVIEHELMLGKTYVYVPRGPIGLRKDAVLALAQQALDHGRATHAMYVKIDPATHDFSDGTELFSGYEPGTTLQEPNTLVLDLRAEPEALLAGMHHKTRYNIRVAERHGVTVRWSNEDADFATYLALQKEMTVRHGIRPHSDRYYRLMFEVFRDAGQGALAMAELHGQVLASNFVLFHETTAVFNHGGSTHEHKEAMAPYVLQWQSILESRRRGMTAYDFRGIAPVDSPHHKLAGVTRFKLGFGGQRIVYPGAQNAVLDRPWWMIYRFAKRMRGAVHS